MESQAEGRFEWTAHPAAERPLVAAAAICVIAAASWLVVAFESGSGWGIFAAILLCLALNRFFFASRFEIDEHGLRAFYPLNRRVILWTDVTEVRASDHTIWVSTSSGRRPMAVFAGGQRLLVVAEIRRRLPERMFRDLDVAESPRRK